MCYLAGWFVFTVDGALNVFICGGENSRGGTKDTGKRRQTGGPSLRREPRRTDEELPQEGDGVARRPAGEGMMVIDTNGFKRREGRWTTGLLPQILLL